MKKGWFSIGKLKDKKNKTPKQEKPKDVDKEKKEALYENFLKDTKQKKKSVENESDTSKVIQPQQPPINDENGKNNNSNKNKRPKSKENQAKKSIEQMIEELDEKEFSDLIKNIKEKFPNSNTAWLFEAAFYLNNNIQTNVKDVLSVFNNSLDYPSKLLKESFKKQLHDLFNLFKKEELYQVQMSIIESIIPNIYLGSGVSGPVGYLLFLQSLSFYLGQNSVENIERLASTIVRNKHKEKPNVYLTQIWCLQNVGFFNLKEGLDIWKKLYSPVLDHKYYYLYSIKYLQQVLNFNNNYKDGQGIIDVKDLIKILKLKTASEHQEILEKVLPKLKLVVLGNLNDKEIANSFNQLMSVLNDFKNDTQSEDFVINCLVFCLEKNKLCFDIWLEYHIRTSGNKDLLLEHLISNPTNIQNQKKAFKSTLQKIAKFNEKQGQSNYQAKDILKSTMNNSKSCRYNFVLLILLALVTYVVYDFRLNGSFERSQTARYLKRWNVYHYVHPAATNIERNIVSLKRQYDVKYGPTVNSYVDQIVKKYDSDVRPTIDPYLGKVVNVSTPYLDSFKANSILAYRAAEKYYATYSKQAGIFLEKNVFTGPLEINNLKIVFNDIFEKFVNAYTDVLKWTSAKIATLTQ